MTKKATKEEVERLRQEIRALTDQVREIAELAGLGCIYLREQSARVKWVRQDSDEWKAEVERMKHQQKLSGSVSFIPHQAPDDPFPWARWG